MNAFILEFQELKRLNTYIDTCKAKKIQYLLKPPSFSIIEMHLFLQELKRFWIVVCGSSFQNFLSFYFNVLTSLICNLLILSFKIYQTFSIGFRSGELLGQFILFILFFLIKSIVFLARCFGSLSEYKFGVFLWKCYCTNGNRWEEIIFLYFSPSIISLNR